MKHFVLLMVSSVFLFSCNTTVKSIKADTDLIKMPTQGYLLIGIETNSSLKSINIDGPQDIKLSHTDLTRGTNFILVDLVAGDYFIEQIRMNNYSRIDISNEDYWRFKIKPQTISYVGHLEVVDRGFFAMSSNLELVNRSTEALEFMQKAFPNILQNRDMYYGGPGDDGFYEFLKARGE